MVVRWSQRSRRQRSLVDRVVEARRRGQSIVVVVAQVSSHVRVTGPARRRRRRRRLDEPIRRLDVPVQVVAAHISLRVVVCAGRLRRDVSVLVTVGYVTVCDVSVCGVTVGITVAGGGVSGAW